MIDMTGAAKIAATSVSTFRPGTRRRPGRPSEPSHRSASPAQTDHQRRRQQQPRIGHQVGSSKMTSTRSNGAILDSQKCLLGEAMDAGLITDILASQEAFLADGLTQNLNPSVDPG